MADKIVATQREWLDEEPPTISGTQNFITALLPLLNQAIKELRGMERKIAEARLEEHKRTCSGSNKCIRCLALGEKRAVEEFRRGIADLEAS